MPGMRLLLFGPRIFGIRTGVSLGRDDFEKAFGKKAATGQSPIDLDHSFVYVIKGEHGRCKIGITGNPRARLDQLQTGSAHPIELAWIGAPAGDVIAIERDAHAMLAQYRRNGEWFEVSHDAAVGAICSAAARRNKNVLGLTLEQADQIVSVARVAVAGQRQGWLSRHPILAFFIALFFTSSLIWVLANQFLFVN